MSVENTMKDMFLEDVISRFIKSNISFGPDPVVLEVPSKYMQWIIFLGISKLYSGINLFHATSKDIQNVLTNTYQSSLFSDMDEGKMTIIFFEGNFSSEIYQDIKNSTNLIILCEKSSLSSKNKISVVNVSDDLIQFCLDFLRGKTESLSLWQEILQTIPKDGDFGRLIYDLGIIVSLEGFINKQILEKYSFELVSDSIVFGMGDIFKDGTYNINKWNETINKQGNMEVIGYLKNSAEKLAFLKGNNKNFEGPLKGMHPYARKKLEEIISSGFWDKKGFKKWGEILEMERLSRTISVPLDDLIKGIFAGV